MTTCARLTQELHRSTLISATVLQSGHIVYGVVYHQLQIRHCILKSEVNAQKFQLSCILAGFDPPSRYNPL